MRLSALPNTGQIINEARSSPPILVANADHYGSIAAIRSLGRAGVPVVTVGPSPLAAGRFSRFTSDHWHCPPFEMTKEFTEWLLRRGRSGPRRVIYATSDAVLLALASRRDELSQFYDLYQPPLPAILSALDKGRLYLEAATVGLAAPQTWIPRDRAEVKGIAREAGGALLVKPRTQLAIRTYSKGLAPLPGVDQLLCAYDEIVAKGPHDPEFAEKFPELLMPLIQRYHPEASQAVYSLAGFRDLTGHHVVMRAANKMLQAPWRLGVGLCFEEADVDETLAAGVMRLCERIGYYGAFEVEFIFVNQQPLLIDFNARFYNQMAFDIARGVDIPRLVYAGTTKDISLLECLMARSRLGPDKKYLLCNLLALQTNILARRAAGTMSKQEAARWRQWASGGSRHVVDAVRDSNDPWPAIIDAGRQMSRLVRHPRASFQQLVFGG